MTRTFKLSLLIASILFATLATSAEACHRHRACQPAPCGEVAYNYASPTGYPSAQGAYVPMDQTYTGGAYAAPPAGYPAGYGGYPAGYGGYGYGFGRPYNPGGLGGPMSGLGVRPGLGFGGLGLGR